MNAATQREALDERILRVMSGAAWRLPTALEAAVLPLLRPGRAAALSIARIQDQVGPFGSEGRLADPREIKEAVSRLVTDFAIPIGGARDHPHGYFLVLTPEDLDLAVRPLVAELRSLSRRVRALAGKKELARLFGQIQMHLDSDAATEAQSTQRRTA